LRSDNNHRLPRFAQIVKRESYFRIRPTLPTMLRWSQTFGFIAVLLLLLSCQKEVDDVVFWKGSGVADFYDDVPTDARLVRIFYFVPEGANAQTPILMCFTGAERNAIEYRNTLKTIASEKNFIVVVPEFSEAAFNLNAYNLGNLFLDGENPSLSTRVPEDEWTFSLVPRLWMFIQNQTGTQQAHPFVLGHSAGAQFLHRLLLFKPDFQIQKAVISAAGWYTLPDFLVDYPYGLQLTTATPAGVSQFFGSRVFIQVGSNDNNPNAASLRRTPEADAQGLNRLERAQYFYQTCTQTAQQTGASFSWSFHIAPGLNHNFGPAIVHGAGLLFQ